MKREIDAGRLGGIIVLMRWFLLVIIGVVLSSGCTTTGKPDPNINPPPPVKPPKDPTTKKERVTPADVRVGRVASVNDSLRFVVLDFLPGQLPAVDKRMNVYRDGQKVGEVKVTGPVIGTNIAADLLAGEAKVGDQARTE